MRARVAGGIAVVVGAGLAGLLWAGGFLRGSVSGEGGLRPDETRVDALATTRGSTLVADGAPDPTDPAAEVAADTPDGGAERAIPLRDRDPDLLVPPVPNGVDPDHYWVRVLDPEDRPVVVAPVELRGLWERAARGHHPGEPRPAPEPLAYTRWSDADGWCRFPVGATFQPEAVGAVGVSSELEDPRTGPRAWRGEVDLLRVEAVEEVRVHLVDADGGPVHGRFELEVRCPGETDSTVRLEADVLPEAPPPGFLVPAGQALEMAARRPAFPPPTWYAVPDADPPGRVRRVELEPDEGLEVLTCRVLGEDGEVLVDELLSLYRQEASGRGPRRSLRTDPRGVLALPRKRLGLARATEVQVRKGNSILGEQGALLELPPSRPGLRHLGDLRLVADPDRSEPRILSGRVELPDGEPVHRARITICPSGRLGDAVRLGTVRTEEDGTFEVRGHLRPGSWCVRASGRDLRSAFTPFTIGSEVRLVAMECGSVRGSLTGVDVPGSPSAFVVRLWSEDGVQVGEARTESPDHAFELDSLLPGVYALTVHLFGVEAPLRTVPRVTVRGGVGADPRLGALDLSSEVRAVRVDLVRGGGEVSVRGTAWVSGGNASRSRVPFDGSGFEVPLYGVPCNVSIELEDHEPVTLEGLDRDTSVELTPLRPVHVVWGPGIPPELEGRACRIVLVHDYPDPVAGRTFPRPRFPGRRVEIGEPFEWKVPTCDDFELRLEPQHGRVEFLRSAHVTPFHSSELRADPSDDEWVLDLGPGRVQQLLDSLEHR